MALGRPSLYSPEIAAEICRRIADGESLNTICKDEHMPSTVTVFSWLKNSAQTNFLNNYNIAREMQAEGYAEEIVGIADDDSGDDGNDSVQRSRLKVDARKWVASKLLPKKYGEFHKIDAEVKAAMSVTIVTGVPERNA